MNTHTQGPLKALPVHESGWVDIYKANKHETNGLPIISTRHENSEANARRLVACWNACEGIDTEDLEAGSVSIIHKLHDATAKRVLEQRDELLAALKDIEAYYPNSWAADTARAAIAKAEGGAV